MRARCVAFAGAVTLAASAAAAAEDGFGVGSRVRVAGLGVAEGGALQEPIVGCVVGRVAALDDRTLTVLRADGSRVAFRQEDLRLLETSPGPRSAARGAVRGAVVLGAIGAAGAFFVPTPFGLEPGGRSHLVGYFGLRAAVLGAALGAALPGEKWSRVEVGRARVGFAPTVGPRGRGAGLGLSVEF